jgi:hypothetical protein
MLYAARIAANISACLTVSMPKVGFEIQIQVEHIFGIASLLSYDLQHLLLNRVVGWNLTLRTGASVQDESIR